MRAIALVTEVVAATGCRGAPYLDHLAGTPLTSPPHFHHNELFVEGLAGGPGAIRQEADYRIGRESPIRRSR